MRLSEREREVLLLFLEGRRQKEIASLLLLSNKTVFAHLDNIRRRHHCRNTVALLLLAIRSGVWRGAGGDCPACGWSGGAA